MKRYLHEAPQQEIDEMIKSGKTWGDLKAIYSQPEWCTYPDALNGSLGCWSLTDLDHLRCKISEKFCADCDCFKKAQS
jgi:hypothetical protein